MYFDKNEVHSLETLLSTYLSTWVHGVTRYKTNYTSLLPLLREITNEKKEVKKLFPKQAASRTR
jgi:hypothetical protein